MSPAAHRRAQPPSGTRKRRDDEQKRKQGAGSGIDPSTGATLIREQIRVIRDDAARLVGIGRAAGLGLEDSVRGSLDRNPYAVLIAAAGVGAALGGALTPGALVLATSSAMRLAAALVLRSALSGVLDPRAMRDRAHHHEPQEPHEESER